MLASLRFAEAQKEQEESSSEDDEQVANADRGTLRSGRIAFDKIKASSFDERDSAKLEFFNLFHTFKNFRLNARKTAPDSLLEYLKLMHELVEYTKGP
mmetsp:Transcript_7228/g.10115  ORF Transcript_7228/g.10115 Transcript_7228/m.10115 type:complete len:98 (+) Transcript_7228:44-337(+)